MNKIIKKLRSKRGFSMGEMLVATAIMVLATSLVTQTLSLGIEQFRARTADSQVQMLGNELVVAIRDELSYAQKVLRPELDDGTLMPNPVFYSSSKSLQRFRARLTTSGVDESGNPVADTGRVNLCYTIKDADTGVENNYYYALVREADSEMEWLDLKESVRYYYDKHKEVFYVTLTIHDENGRIADYVRDFVVQPISASVTTD